MGTSSAVLHGFFVPLGTHAPAAGSYFHAAGQFFTDGRVIEYAFVHVTPSRDVSMVMDTTPRFPSSNLPTQMLASMLS